MFFDLRVKGGTPWGRFGWPLPSRLPHHLDWRFAPVLRIASSPSRCVSSKDGGDESADSDIIEP